MPTAAGGDVTVASAMSVVAMTCVLEETDATDAIMSQVEQTNSLMGRQDVEWDDFTLSWSYHPDSGASAVFEES